MANIFNQVLKAGLQANYDALGSKDPNVLYFCTDSKKIYKGDIDFTESCIPVTSKPLTPVAGKLYFISDTNSVEAYINGAWTVVSAPIATTIDASSDDLHTVSAKAVYDAIRDLSNKVTASTDIVKSVSASTTAATLAIEKADGTTNNVLVQGVATKPTWDASARKLTIPVTGDTAVEVELGKDIFIDPAADNKFNTATGNIEIYLNDGDGSNPATKIEIPASSLVDTYTGEATTSATTSVVDNKISVAIKIDPDSGNALVVGSDGLKVDLSNYSTTTEMNAAIKVAKDAADAAQATADSAASAITTLQGTGDGSVKKAVDDAVAASKAATDADIAAIDTRLTTVEADLVNAAAATAWGTF